jgi:hypothetical protein
VTLLAVICTLAATPPVAAAEPSSSSRTDALAVVGRALQVSDDAVYLPVQSHGRWTLASLGSWLQPSISTTSSPWRWTATGRCTVFDPSLIAGMTAFMHDQIEGTFGGSAAAQITSTFDTKVRRLEPAPCQRPPGGLALGPPGPLRDRTSVRYIAFTGSTATAAAVVHMTDWQGGVTKKPTPGGGRRVNWAVVSNAVDVTYRLALTGGGWRVVALTGRFAPGSEP